MFLKEFGGVLESNPSDMKGVNGVVEITSMYTALDSVYDKILVTII